ncbi:MAG: hypothetical protein HY064_05655 [Bacteroidetes bacterium]|nr:hypothetical protein [Bacteroidota bacterium]
MKTLLPLFILLSVQLSAQFNSLTYNRQHLPDSVIKANKIRSRTSVLVFDKGKSTDRWEVDYDADAKITGEHSISNTKNHTDSTRVVYIRNANGDLTGKLHFSNGKLTDSVVVIHDRPDYSERTYSNGKLIGWEETKGDSLDRISIIKTMNGKDTATTMTETKMLYNSSGKLMLSSKLYTTINKGKVDTTYFNSQDYGNPSITKYFLTFGFADVHESEFEYHYPQADTIFGYTTRKGKPSSTSVIAIDSLGHFQSSRFYNKKKKIFALSNYSYDSNGKITAIISKNKKGKTTYTQTFTRNSKGLLDEEKKGENLKKPEVDLKYEYTYYQ